MEEKVSGFWERGSWEDTVEHGERISRALRECGVDGEAFSEWDDWRPKPHERMESDVSRKTAEKASVGEGAGERKGKSPDEDLRAAGERLSESYAELEEDDTSAAMEKWHDSVDYVARAADSAGRKVLRRVENTVYQNVMTQVAPYYFDNELISANVQRVGSGEEEEFVFEVNVNDDELKEEVSRKLADFEDRIDRWHGETEKVVETAEAAEGVEVTKAELERTSAEPPEEELADPKVPEEPTDHDE